MSIVCVNKLLQCSTQWGRSYWVEGEGGGGEEGEREEWEGGKEGGRKGGGGEGKH